MRYQKHILPLVIVLLVTGPSWAGEPVTINAKDDGYRGIWYFNQPSGDAYVYKYSGGLGTYCAKHQPFAVYCQKVNKTFFCYGGTTKNSDQELVHMVSYYDHATGMVPRPTILLNKRTSDAHDNPVISIDGQGHVWIFSTSHGRSRPSYIHRSKRPYDIDAFELVPATREPAGQDVPITNFSYMQAWHVPTRGFVCFFTRYNDPAQRTSFFMTSPDGVRWSEWLRLAAIDWGHYQISTASARKAAAVCNFHPEGKGLNWRTNLYYMETADWGKSWQSAGGDPLALPLNQPDNPALVHDYRADGLNVYLKDVRLDADDRPVILYLTSRGYESGPQNDPRTWTTACWTGRRWEIRPVTTSDNNYDMGSLYLESDGRWRIIAPTEPGPQPYNPGGEIAMWQSGDRGGSWQKVKQLTHDSPRNHTYVRRPVDAHPDFYALWADGHGREPSPSTLYFCDRQGNVSVLPREMPEDFARPVRLAE
ncbi:MAG TPA: BNR-4 repeat-containing protein [Thermoguttaceae bacterium]|nr:BNR-4 repeat-containing protein [Thermoguttaceae bacterium]